MPLNSAHRRHEAVGDFPVGQARGNQFGDLALTAGQPDGYRRTAQRRCAQAATFFGQLLRQRRGVPAALARLRGGQRDGRLGRGVGGGRPVTDLPVAGRGREQPVTVTGR